MSVTIVRKSSTTDLVIPKHRSTLHLGRKLTSTASPRVRPSVTKIRINTVASGLYVVPSAGFVNFVTRVKPEKMDSYGIRRASKKRVRLTEQTISELNQLQHLGNRAGFVVALVCPKDGEVVKTRRTGELDDGEAAVCPRCGKTWYVRED